MVANPFPLKRPTTIGGDPDEENAPATGDKEIPAEPSEERKFLSRRISSDETPSGRKWNDIWKAFEALIGYDFTSIISGLW
jgi:hypothetical protein